MQKNAEQKTSKKGEKFTKNPENSKKFMIFLHIFMCSFIIISRKIISKHHKKFEKSSEFSLVIVFDLSYLPVAAVGTKQVRDLEIM